MPSGVCQEVFGAPPLTAHGNCLAMGGEPFGAMGNYEPVGGACEAAMQGYPPGIQPCMVGACNYQVTQGDPATACINLSYYYCKRQLYAPTHYPYGLCQVFTPLNTTIKAFPVFERGFPYRLEFAMATWGFEHLCCNNSGLCIPSTQEACQSTGGTWGLYPMHRERGFAYDWRSNTNHRTINEPAAQMGRIYLDRRKRCRMPDGTYNPTLTTQVECETFQGEWLWDGIPYLSPAANLVSVFFGGCSATFKNVYFSQQGFWWPDKAPISPGGIYLAPPKWSGQIRFASGSAPLEVPDYYLNARYAQDYPFANTYQWMVLLPVEPLDAFDPSCCTQQPHCVPYCNEPNAPNEFPFNDSFTYEIPCYTRDHTQVGAPPYFVAGTPYRNRSFGDGLTVPDVPAGVKGIVAYSPGDAKHGYLYSYCDEPGAGCPQNYDCDDLRCVDLWENIYRKYGGVTSVKTYEWASTPDPDNDPDRQKWSVTYYAEIWAWFVQDSNWTLATNLSVVPFRWNAWYEGVVEAKIVGDVSNQAFASWIMTHDSGYGVEFGPRYTRCNDVLKSMEGMDNALGDTIYPGVAAQAGCKGSIGVPTAPAPCFGAGLTSYWYRPDRGAPLPENGLYHETQRKRYTNLARTQFTTDYGWAKLAFSTTVPKLIAAGGL